MTIAKKNPAAFLLLSKISLESFSEKFK